MDAVIRAGVEATALAQYPWTADGTLHRGSWQVCAISRPLRCSTHRRRSPLFGEITRSGGKRGARSGPWRVARGPWRVQITRPLPRSLVRCLPDRGLWSPSPSCDALALRHPGREERTERHSAASSYATWRLSGFGVALVWQCEELRLGPGLDAHYLGPVTGDAKWLPTKPRGRLKNGCATALPGFVPRHETIQATANIFGR